MTGNESKERPAKVGRSIMIIGIGNSYRGDDGAGLAASRMLRERVPRGASVLERDGEPAALIAAWQGADAAILIDAVSSGSAPGKIHAIDVSTTRLDRDLFRRSTHAFGVAEAVELSRALGTLPGEVWMYGIEGKDFGTSRQLSDEVLRAVAETVRTVIEKIEEIVSRPMK
jgi:hydrogenase maturation protease